MRSPGINGEGELRGQLANPGSPGNMAIKTECVCMCIYKYYLQNIVQFCRVYHLSVNQFLDDVAKPTTATANLFHGILQ